MDVSIIIVTRNRAGDLKLTLEALKALEVPDGMKVEVLVVDNGSTDDTVEAVRSVKASSFQFRYLLEPAPGQTFGRNRGLAETTGNIILFTDDDVRPPCDWLLRMCDPIAGGVASAVRGGVRLAPNLVRPWMTDIHHSWLAATDHIVGGAEHGLVGANMGFSRSVLGRVPGFDTELGPGASGFADDDLFALQVQAAGFRIFDYSDVVIEHHFQESRLLRESWLKAAEQRGVSHAYVGHHWEHWGYRMGSLRAWRASWKLESWRKRNPDKLTTEGCDCQEMDLIYHKAIVDAHVALHHQERKYDYHGLVKRGGIHKLS